MLLDSSIGICGGNDFRGTRLKDGQIIIWEGWGSLGQLSTDLFYKMPGARLHRNEISPLDSSGYS